MRLPRNSPQCSGVPPERNFTIKLQPEKRQLSVYRESTTLFAMKSASSEISFLRVWFGMSLRPGTSKPRTTAESPSKVSHEVCNWLNSSHVLSAPALGPRAARKRLLRSLFQVRPEGTRSRLATKDSIGQKKLVRI